MGCNCKRKIDAVASYAGETADEVGTNLLTRVGRFFAQMVFGIIAFALIIVMTVPFFIYLFFCLVTGTEARVRFTKNGIKIGKGKKDGGKPQLQDKG